ncbi:unnamed protein product [Nyctereutes procyonoides]|uniref:(raccoon dog) hypothetical protein n=1 Tax=Nyctereutes procyonoides TaxID=34880 RepID=A0A811XZP3_NYCPR|nr:unnamed protein product [Nyctereutes procyonoides]
MGPVLYQKPDTWLSCLSLENCLPTVNHNLKTDDLSSEYHQKVSNNLTLSHRACVIHLTSSHHVGILSSHIITRRRKLKLLTLTPVMQAPLSNHSHADCPGCTMNPNGHLAWGEPWTRACVLSLTPPVTSWGGGVLEQALCLSQFPPL